MHPVILLLLSSITTDLVWLLIFTRFLDHTQRRTTVGRTPLDEWSVRRRDLYLPLPDNTQQSQQTNIHAPRRAEDFYWRLKIRRLRPGLNPRTWVPKASTLPLDHQNHWVEIKLNFTLCMTRSINTGTFIAQLDNRWKQWSAVHSWCFTREVKSHLPNYNWIGDSKVPTAWKFWAGDKL